MGGKIQIWVGKIDFGGFEIRTKLDFWRSRKIGSKFFGVRKSKVFVRNPKFFLVNSALILQAEGLVFDDLVLLFGLLLFASTTTLGRHGGLAILERPFAVHWKAGGAIG